MSFVNILKRTDIFYDLNNEQLEMVAALCHEVRFRMGEMIFEEQSASDELYVIARGEIEILVDPSIIEASLAAVSRMPASSSSRLPASEGAAPSGSTTSRAGSAPSLFSPGFSQCRPTRLSQPVSERSASSRRPRHLAISRA